MASRPTRTRRKKPRPLESSRHTPCAVRSPRHRPLLIEPLERRHLLASYTTPEDTPLVVPAAGVQNAAIETPPTRGSVSLGANGAFTYTPNLNYYGTDNFSYRHSTGTEAVTISITPVNDPPIAASDSYSVAEEGQLTVSVENGVKANDTDVDSGFLNAALLQQPSNGTLAFGGNGNFVYRPAANFSGIDRFTYLVSDGQALSNIGTVTISVTNTNDAPIAVNDRYTVAANWTATINASGVLANDIDIDGDSLTATIIGQPARGTLILNANGSFTYVATGSNGAESFSYRAEDGPTSSTATVTLNVGPINRAPVAVNDIYIYDAGTASIAAPGVLGNDSDQDGDSVAAVLVSGPAEGSLTLRANGSFTYVPANANYNSVTFTYRITDGQVSSTATVSLINVPCGCPVTPANDHYMVIEDAALSVPAPGVLANDPNPTGGTLTATLIDQPRFGFVSLLPNGSFTLLPAANFNGQASFTYRSSDSLGNSRILTAGFTVLGVNDLPVAANDSYTVSEDNPLTIAAPGILLNDHDIDGNPISAVLASQTANGTVSLNANGSFEYWPNANYNGPDSFTYRATDGVDISNVATVTISVTPVTDPPVARNDNYSMFRNMTLSVASPGILTNDTDADGQTLTAQLEVGPNNGSLTLNANGSFTFVPAQNLRGSDSFSYRVSDGVVQSISAIVFINVGACGAPPYASNDAYTTAEDLLLSVSAPGILANDDDCGELLTNPSLITAPPPAKGTLTLNSDGSFAFAPAPNFHGTASFTYRALGYGASSNTAVVTITVTPVNDPPVANDDSYTADSCSASTLSIPRLFGVLGNDTDVEGDTLTASLINGPAHGQLSFNGDGSFTYVRNAPYFSVDTFTYRASDGLSSSHTATVTINATLRACPPVALNDAFAIAEDSVLSVPIAQGVLANDFDGDGDTLNALLVSPPSAFSGVLSLNPTGSFTFVPALNFHGVTSFTYLARDPLGMASNVATVTITVTPVNDPPVAINDSYSVAAGQILRVSVPGVIGNDSDVDSSTLTATVFQGIPGLSVNISNGSFTYGPAPAGGTVSFTYRIHDGQLVSSPATVIIRIQPNDPPFANNDLYTVQEDEVLNVGRPGVLSNDFEPDQDTITAIPVAGPSQGTLSLHGDGSFRYAPNLDFCRTDSFTYQAHDGQLRSLTTATVTIAVMAANLPLTAVNDGYTLAEDETLSIVAPGVLQNDIHPGGDALSPVLMARPTHGSLTLNANGSFSYTPLRDYFGSDRFTYRNSQAGDACQSNIATVLLTVTSVNDPPTFLTGPNPNVGDESGPQSIAAWATLVSAGPPDEAGQSLSFTVTNDRPNLFSAQPAIDSGGRLTFTPAPNGSGTATVTVILKDSGGTADGGSDTSPPQTFLITITKQRPAHNLLMPLDATGDSRISPLDALVIINFLNRQGPGPVTPGSAFFYDINGDGHITALDALIVMNHFNRLAAAGEAESASAAPSFNPQPEAQALPLHAEGEAPDDNSNLIDLLALDTAHHTTRRRRVV
jgi:hypothetical protein